MLKVHGADERFVDRAIAAVEEHGLSIRNLLWTAADRAGASYLIMQDVQDRRVLGGPAFISPLNSADADLLERKLPSTS